MRVSASAAVVQKSQPQTGVDDQISHVGSGSIRTRGPDTRGICVLFHLSDGMACNSSYLPTHLGASNSGIADPEKQNDFPSPHRQPQGTLEHPSSYV